MTGTLQRDRVAALAKTDSDRALIHARAIADPWFRAQALAHVARHSPTHPCAIATEAAEAAQLCDDHFKRSAVRAWEIAALAERGKPENARRSLRAAIDEALLASPEGSRCESLLLLLHAAARLSITDTLAVAELLRNGISADGHWRCLRALTDAAGILAHFDANAAIGFAETVLDETARKKCFARIAAGGTAPRPFYW